MSRARARVTIAGETYTIGCAPGEEGRIGELAGELEQMMTRLTDRLGDVGDTTLAVMAGLSALERLSRAEAANAKLRARIEALERAREAAALAIDGDDETLVARLEKVAATVERVAGLINRDTRLRSGADTKGAMLRAVAISDEKPPLPEAPGPVTPEVPDAAFVEEPFVEEALAEEAPEDEAMAEAALEPAEAAPVPEKRGGGRLDISPAAGRR